MSDRSGIIWEAMDPTPKRNLIRVRRILPRKKITVGNEGRKVNEELVDLDLRSIFEFVTSK